MDDLSKRMKEAVKFFWKTRSAQGSTQGKTSGRRDTGNRKAATGGKQLNGISNLIADLLFESGIPRDSVHTEGREGITLPGFFRPTKIWDVLAIVEGNLLAAIECKSLCGPSFGNNYNNRIEEALGCSTDVWTAYREGAFNSSPEPFVGYLLLVEEHPKSTKPVKVNEKNFSVFDEFRDASYIQRSEQSLRRLVRERCYHSASLIVSSKDKGKKGQYSSPSDDLSFERFATLMCGHVKAAYQTINKHKK